MNDFKLNGFQMQIVAKYFKTTEDYINLIRVNKKFIDIPRMFRINPIPIENRHTAKMFDLIETITFDPLKDYPGYVEIYKIKLLTGTAEDEYKIINVDGIDCLIKPLNFFVVIFGDFKFEAPFQHKLLKTIRDYICDKIAVFPVKIPLHVNCCHKFDRDIVNTYFESIEYVIHK